MDGSTCIRPRRLGGYPTSVVVVIVIFHADERRTRSFSTLYEYESDDDRFRPLHVGTRSAADIAVRATTVDK
jgi:hypothetical protein